MHPPFVLDEVETHPGHRIFHLAGALDTTGATLLAERATAVLEAGQDLVVNLAGIAFISSSGIGVLMAMSEDFRERGLTLSLSEPSREVLAPIQMLCLDQFLRICGSDDEACGRRAA